MGPMTIKLKRPDKVTVRGTIQGQLWMEGLATTTFSLPLDGTVEQTLQNHRFDDFQPGTVEIEHAYLTMEWQVDHDTIVRRTFELHAGMKAIGKLFTEEERLEYAAD